MITQFVEDLKVEFENLNKVIQGIIITLVESDQRKSCFADFLEGVVYEKFCLKKVKSGQSRPRFNKMRGLLETFIIHRNSNKKPEKEVPKTNQSSEKMDFSINFQEREKTLQSEEVFSIRRSRKDSKSISMIISKSDDKFKSDSSKRLIIPQANKNIYSQNSFKNFRPSHLDRHQIFEHWKYLRNMLDIYTDKYSRFTQLIEKVSSLDSIDSNNNYEQIRNGLEIPIAIPLIKKRSSDEFLAQSYQERRIDQSLKLTQNQFDRNGLIFSERKVNYL